MNETPMLFPITPIEFWKQIRTTIDEVVAERLSQQTSLQTNPHLPEKLYLKQQMSERYSRYQGLRCTNG